MENLNECDKCRKVKSEISAKCFQSSTRKSGWSVQILLISLLIATWSVGKTTGAPATGGRAEKLCGAKLVDALRFLCGARGIYTPEVSGIGPRSRYRTILRKPSADITELCCQRGCTPNQLEQYCGKSAPKTVAEMRRIHQRRLARLLPYGRRLRHRAWRRSRT